MNDKDRVNDIESESTSNAPPTDTSDKPVKEQDAEELQRKIAEIERKVADGN